MRSFNIKAYSIIIVLFLSLFTSLFFVNCSGEGFDAFEEKVMGADPLVPLAWYLLNTGQGTFSKNVGTPGNDLRLARTWEAGIQGRDVTILVSDDGIDHQHEDLNANMKTGNVHLNFSSSSSLARSAAAPPLKIDSNHGTNVAGLIGAVRNNGKGITGVAPLVNIVSSNFLSHELSEFSMMAQVSENVDIVNMSWGARQNKLSSIVPGLITGMANGARTGRSGLGRIYVKSAGNDFKVFCAANSQDTCLGNSNFDDDNTTPFTIVVSSLAAEPMAAAYSSPGSNIWISALGGESNENFPTIVTTDRTGCTQGVANKNSKSARIFERGRAGNEDCKYTTLFTGTSAAAPMVSGVVALMLEANPLLSWREIKHILAATATKIDSQIGNQDHPLRASSPPGHVYEQGWVRNKAGYEFHNWYGFGRVNADAAVEMAKNFKVRFGASRNAIVNATIHEPMHIPDFSAAGVNSLLNVYDNFLIEAVQIEIAVNHPFLGNLGIELTSPQGTKSIIWNVNNGLKGAQNLTNRRFLTNAFYGESSIGIWTLKVIDGGTGNTGTLNAWSINIMGRD